MSKLPVRSTNGWTVGGMHKASYKVDETNFSRFNREYIYIPCECNVGYDHEASWYFGNPPLEKL